MAWATTTQIRLVSGLTSGNISDADLNSIITLSDREVAKHVLEYHYAVRCDGTINGSNTTFALPYKPIGDKDQSGTVDASDVTAYTIDQDGQGNDVSTQVSISSINARDGLITLSSAPDGVLEVVADYATIDPRVVMEDVHLASSYLAALMAMINVENGKTATAPYSYSAGRFSITKSSGSAAEAKLKLLEKEYQRLLDQVISSAEIQSVRPSGSVLDRSRFPGRGTTSGAVVDRNRVGDRHGWD